MVHFQVVNGPGNKLHPEIVLTEMIFSQAYLPGKHSSSRYIYFVRLYQRGNWTETSNDSDLFWCFHIFPKEENEQENEFGPMCLLCAQVTGDKFIPWTLFYIFPVIFLSSISLLCVIIDNQALFI